MSAEIRHRHTIPVHWSLRWFTTRGWAVGGALAFYWAAAFLRPPSLDVPIWIPVVMFGAAGTGLAWLALRPESTLARYAAVAAVVASSVGRACALAVAGSNPVGTKIAGTGIWLLIAYWCWMLAVLTAQVPSRHSGSR